MATGSLDGTGNQGGCSLH